MKVTMENFAKAKYDVFSMFNEQWGLCTAGNAAEYNTMTIGWGTMGTIRGPPNKGKQIITVFLRESRRTSDILLKDDNFTVCFFPEENAGIWGFSVQNPAEMFRTRSSLQASLQNSLIMLWALRRQS